MATISKAEYAKRRGVAKATISRWISLGLPVTPDQKIDIVVANTWLEKNLLASKDSDDSYAVARRRGEAARAELAELELAAKRGELVPLASVKLLWSELGSQLQNGIMQVPDRLCVQLSRMTDARQIRQLMVEELTHALKALSRTPVPSLGNGKR